MMVSGRRGKTERRARNAHQLLVTLEKVQKKTALQACDNMKAKAVRKELVRVASPAGPWDANVSSSDRTGHPVCGHEC